MYNYDYNWMTIAEMQLEEYFREECKGMDADKLDLLLSCVEDYDELCDSFYQGFSIFK